MRIPRDTRTTDGNRLENGSYLVYVKKGSISAVKMTPEMGMRIIDLYAEERE